MDDEKFVMLAMIIAAKFDCEIDVLDIPNRYIELRCPYFCNSCNHTWKPLTKESSCPQCQSEDINSNNDACAIAIADALENVMNSEDPNQAQTGWEHLMNQ